MTNAMDVQLPGGTLARVAVQRQVFQPWLGPPPPITYGPKPIIEHAGRGVFAEIAFAGLLRQQGWEAVWASTFGGLRYFRDQPQADRSNTVVIREDVVGFVDRIAMVNGSLAHAFFNGMWDVVAWRQGDIRFHELKRASKDRIRPTQRRWLWAALQSGVDADRFRIVEWDFARS